MKKSSRLTNALILAAALSATLFLGYGASAVRNAAPRPVTIATVDLEKIFENLRELSAEQGRLQNVGKQMDTENESRFNKLKQMQEEFDLTPKDSPRLTQIEEALVNATIEYQAWKEFQLRRIDREKALVLEKVYNSVKRSIAAYAQQQGYDIVMLNDSIKPLQRGTEQSVQQQISARRLLYTNPALDITNELLTKMNNDFNTGGG